ncbi:hypothetical protein Ciccas_014390, partial [Cichlidogyrus casuarinus]
MRLLNLMKLTMVCCCASLLEGSSCDPPFTLKNSICFVMYGNENLEKQSVSDEFVKCSAIGGRPPFLDELNAVMDAGLIQASIPNTDFAYMIRLAAHYLFTRPDRFDMPNTIYDLRTRSLRKLTSGNGNFINHRS